MNTPLADPKALVQADDTAAYTSCGLTRWYITGTSDGLWRSLALSLTRHLEARVDAVTVAPVEVASEAVAEPSTSENVRVLVFVSPPECTLISSLTDGTPPPDPTVLIDLWHRTARRLLALAYRASDRCLFIDTYEAEADASAFAHTLGMWHPDLAQCDELSGASTETNGLLLALARSAADADAAARRTYVELQATCAPLTGDDQPRLSSRPVVDWAATFQQYRALVTQRDEAQSAAEASAAEQSVQLKRTQRAEQALAATRQELGVSRTEHETARAELQQLRTHLHATQDELERTFLDRAEFERQWADARASAAGNATRLDAAESRTAQARAELAAFQRRSEEHQSRAEQAEAQLQQLRDKIAALAAIQAEADRERRSLLQRVQSAEESLVAAQRAAEHSRDVSELQQVETRSVREQLEAANSECTRLRAESTGARTQLESAREAIDKQVELRKASQDELERLQLSHMQVLERLRTELDAAVLGRTLLTEQLAQVLAGAERNRESSAANERRLTAELSDLRNSASAARQESDLVHGRLQLIHRAIERQQSRERYAGVPPPLELQTVTLGQSRLDSPHLELCVQVRGVRVLGRFIDTLDLRLVEHHGHVGMVFVKGGDGVPPLKAWHENGREEDRGQMLLVPADAPAMHMLSVLGTQDWLLLLGVIDGIDFALRSTPAAEGMRWRGVARRLRAELDAMPGRLRYDDLRVVTQVGSIGPEILVRFGHVLFGQRYLEELTVRWCTDARRDPIALIGPRTDDEAPALFAWPAGDHGRWASVWTAPLGGGVDAAGNRESWRSLPSIDRALVAAVLDAMPASVHILSAESRLPEGHDSERLVGRLLKLQAEANDGLLPDSPLSRVARRLRAYRGNLKP